MSHVTEAVLATLAPEGEWQGTFDGFVAAVNEHLFYKVATADVLAAVAQLEKLWKVQYATTCGHVNVTLLHA